MKETTTTLTFAPLLPTLPLDIVEEILCRLPVKLLLQLRCLCKPWNSLISDPKFAKKHLSKSTRSPHLLVSSINNFHDVTLSDLPIPSVFSNSSVTPTQLSYLDSLKKIIRDIDHVSSCDGILCFGMSDSSAVLWNPSIRKFKTLPSLNKQPRVHSLYSFGYDHFINCYKIIAISSFRDKKEVSVHTLGTDFWRRIQDFPNSYYPSDRSGLFVSNTVNWLAYDDSSSSFIVSLDLEKESYQKIWQPGLKKHNCILGMLKDCLCIFARSQLFLDVWVMKEYGNKESWTKLYNASCSCIDQGYWAYKNILYIYEDGQMLMDFYGPKLKFGLYNFKNGTLKILENQNINCWMNPEIYVESLISP